MWAIFVKHYI
jgi:hypothetical protein